MCLAPILIGWAFQAMVPSFAVPEPGAVLITGAGSGIGRETALSLSAAMPSHRFYGLVRKESQAVELEKASEGRVKGIIGDMTDESSLDAAVQTLRASLERDGLGVLALVHS